MNQQLIPYSNRVKYLLFILGVQLLAINIFKDYSSLPDLPDYVVGFEHVGRNGYDIQWGTGMRMTEPGWVYINVFLSYIYSDPWILFAFVGAVIVWGHLKTYMRYSDIPWLSVYLFLCTMFCQSLYVLRQHLAIALCLLTIPYIIKRKFLLFLCLIIMATSIHNTAIVFFIAYWVYPLKVGRKFFISCLGLGFLSYVFLSSSFVDIIGGSDTYASYAEGERTNATAFLISLCVIVLALYAIPFKKIQNELKFFFILSCIAMCINIGGMGVSITGRLNMYFTVFSILLVPNAISKLPSAMKMITIVVVMIAYAVLSFSSISYTGAARDLRLIF